MLVRARQKAAKRGDRAVSFGVGDATQLPVADESVDVWCSAFVVRNIPDLGAALGEAWRVLRPGRARPCWPSSTATMWRCRIDSPFRLRR